MRHLEVLSGFFDGDLGPDIVGNLRRVPPLPAPLPTSPPLPPGEPPREASNSQRSRKSIEKQRFQDNVDALGL